MMLFMLFFFITMTMFWFGKSRKLSSSRENSINRFAEGIVDSYLSNENNKSLPRILVHGMSCAGKSTLGKQLASDLNLHRIELDYEAWLPNWKRRSNGEIHERVSGILDDLESKLGLGTREESKYDLGIDEQSNINGWVVDGNYSAIREKLWKYCNRIVVLDYSFSTVFIRSIKRSLSRAYYQTDVCNGNRESWWQVLCTRDSIIYYVWWYYSQMKVKLTQWVEILSDREEYSNLLDFHIFTCPEETAYFVERIEALCKLKKTFR